MFKGIDAQRLVAVFVGGWVVFNYPLLGLWDQDAALFGLPAFPVALFLIWALLIAMVAWLMERPGADQAQD